MRVTFFDWTGTPLARALRIVHNLRSGTSEPLADARYIDEIAHLTTAEQRHENGERLLRLRRTS